MRVHVPEPVRRLFDRRGPITIGAFGLLAIATEPLEVWPWRVFVVVTGSLLALVIDLWIESGRQSLRIASLQSASERVLQLESEVQSLEAERLNLADEVDALRGLAAAPQTTLNAVLAGLIAQRDIIETVERHRAVLKSGPAEWPIVRLELSGDNAVVTAYGSADHGLENEPVSAADPQGSIIGVGVLVSSRPNTVVAHMGLETIAPYVADELQGRRFHEPSGMVLKLAGFSVQPYANVSDADLDRIRSVLAECSTAISQLLGPPSALFVSGGQQQLGAGVGSEQGVREEAAAERSTS